MLGTKIQKAAANIHSCQGLEYLIFIWNHDKMTINRIFAVMRYAEYSNHASLRRHKANSLFEKYAYMDMERREGQDGKIRRTFEGNAMESPLCNSPREIRRNDGHETPIVIQTC